MGLYVYYFLMNGHIVTTSCGIPIVQCNGTLIYGLLCSIDIILRCNETPHQLENGSSTIYFFDFSSKEEICLSVRPLCKFVELWIPLPDIALFFRLNNIRFVVPPEDVIEFILANLGLHVVAVV